MLGRIRQWMQGSPGNQQAATLVGGGPGPLSILMICSGNICRSPTAEAVLRVKLQRSGLTGVLVDSAGTHGFHVSEPPDPRAQAAARRRGYDLSRLRARPVQDNDFERFQWLLAMDQSHLSWLQQRLPAAQAKRARLLMDHARRFKGTVDVPDPYYGSPEGFERVLDLVEDACDGLVDMLSRQRGGGHR
jgi:protein-tyrosine phosphatase